MCKGYQAERNVKMFFSYFRNNNYNIYCLQDTHFTEDREEFIRNEWGYT